MACFNPLNPLDKSVSVFYHINSRHKATGPVPVAFLFFQCRYTQKFIDSLLWIIGLHLLGVVVFIFDSNVSRFIVVGVFVLEVITNIGTG